MIPFISGAMFDYIGDWECCCGIVCVYLCVAQDNLYACTSYAHSHSKLHQKLELVLNLLAHVDSLGMVEVPMCLEHLQRCAALSGASRPG